MEAKTPLSLVFDIGTQSTRALLFDKQGNLVCKTQHSEPFYMSDTDDIAEKDTVDFYNGVVNVAKQLVEAIPERLKDIVAVSVTSIRNTLSFLDDKNNPTRKTIMWMDKREVQCKKPLPRINRFLYFMVGMSEAVRVSRKTAYTNWVREKQPDIWDKTKTIVFPSCYVNYKLTGNLVDSNASIHGKVPFNYKKRRWMKKYELNYPIFGCPSEKMSKLINPGDLVGYLTEEFSKETGLPAGIPVIATGADKSCESLGVGAVNSKVASISLGTASCIEICTDKYVEPESFMPAYPSVILGKFNPEIQIFRGFWMVTWFKKQFAQYEAIEAKKTGEKIERILDKKIENVPVGSHGLLLQPYWGPGLKNPEAKGSIIGFTDVHTREYIYRAIIEGLTYGLYDAMKNMEMRSKIKVERLGISGGGSQSNVICQIVSDIFGLPVFRVQTHETSGLGSAMIGFTGVGEFKDIYEALDKMRHVKDEFVPIRENNEIYNKYYSRVYRRMYKYLHPLYQELYDILDENRK